MTLPPYADLLGVALEDGVDGAPVLILPFADHVVGRPGFLHGGAIAGLLELAAVTAVRHALGGRAEGAAVRIRLLTITTDYQRGGRSVQTRADARVTRLGARVANVVATAWQDDRDRPIATARVNCLLERG